MSDQDKAIQWITGFDFDMPHLNKIQKTIIAALEQNTHIYCEECQEIKPIKHSYMGGYDTSGEFGDAADIMCGECGLVIATTYTHKP